MLDSTPPAAVSPASVPETGRRLEIFINHVKLGTLHEDNDLWTLAYSPEWVTRPDSFDLSPGLPRSTLVHRDGATQRPVQWYFDNLLPEEQLRELIATDAQLRTHDDAFALLEYPSNGSIDSSRARSYCQRQQQRLPTCNASMSSMPVSCSTSRGCSNMAPASKCCVSCHKPARTS